MFITTTIWSLLFFVCIAAQEFGYNSRDVTNPQEEDKTLHRRRSPCGKNAPQEEARTFLDWSLSFLNVNNNYNYGSSNCGGLGGGGHRPTFSGHGYGQGGGGPLGLGLFNGGLFGGGSRPGLVRPEPQKPDTNDNRPVNDDYDDVAPDKYQKLKPGQYVAVQNPLLGNYVAGFNTNKAIKQINRELDWFLQPLYDLFRR